MKKIVFRGCLSKVLLVFLCCLGSKQVLATSSNAMQTIDQLTKYADLVVHGRVGLISSFMEDNQIFTNIQVSVNELYKGRASSKMVNLRLYGGVANGKRTRVLGAPCLTSGEEVVLFLKSDKRGSFGVLNLAEGKFNVVTDRYGVKKVSRDLSDIQYLQKTQHNIPHLLKDLKEVVLKHR